MNTRLLFLAGTFLAAAPVTPAFAAFAEEVRQALHLAMEDARQALAESGLPHGQTLSVLPLQNDSDRYVEGLMKNAVTAAGMTYVEGREDPIWDDVLQEIEWAERKSDILDESTLTRFGRLKSTQLLLYGAVREASSANNRVFVELEMHVSSIETKQHLWGRVFTQRFYLPGEVQGIIAMNEAVRALLKEALAPVAASLVENPKLAAIRSVAIVPLSGDIDGYVTGLVQDTLSRTPLYPKDLDLQTLAEARLLLRGQPDLADAVLYGAVRDLYRERHQETFDTDVYKMHAELQLRIQDANTGEVLWSDTLAAEAFDAEAGGVVSVIMAYLRDRPAAAIAVGGVLILTFVGLRLVRMAQRRPPR